MTPTFIEIKDTSSYVHTINISHIAQIYQSGDNLKIELSSGTSIEVRTQLSILKRKISGEDNS